MYNLIRRYILPLLPVQIFFSLFSKDYGRKSKDLQSMIGFFVMQALFDMTDKQTVESYNFDQRFHYALNIKESDSYLATRTFYYYKEKILGNGRAIFDSVLKKIDDLIEINTFLQRTDSTLATLNLKKMSQWELFKIVLIKVLKDIKETFNQDFRNIPEEIQKYVQNDESNTWFVRFSPGKAGEYVQQAARDALVLRGLFLDHPGISQRESFSLLLRLIEEQVTITGDDKLKVEIKDEHKSSALSNPHDTEAQYNGHKKTAGVKMTLFETCSQDSPDPHIITNVEVDKANVSDNEILEQTIEHREENYFQPKVELADNGFESDENHQALAEKDIDLVAPPTGETPDGFVVFNFEVDESDHTIKSCPMGQECREYKVNHKSEKTSSYFDIDKYQRCPHSHDCTVKITNRKAKVEWNRSKPRLELKRLIFEQDKETIELLRLRSCGEALMSELKNTPRRRWLRISGFAKAELAIVLRVVTLNIKRLFNRVIMHHWSSVFKFLEIGRIQLFLNFYRLLELLKALREPRYIALAAWHT